ncbi:hypothetical protein D9758_016064 [Tetrapyrgos nigripes]|uniref:Aminotransferase class I/classII large domain-containing protein n=1 Tax=Tetrapyrgos nigripes TaxID=182062 RepID=A0A8H5FEF6_9AGAR|nr:hypothetical protein D9758_016064 [Tetrapyrgos nigripes]
MYTEQKSTLDLLPLWNIQNPSRKSSRNLSFVGSSHCCTTEYDKKSVDPARIERTTLWTGITRSTTELRGHEINSKSLHQIIRNIPTAYAWGAQFVPSPTRPKLDMSQGVPGTPPHPIFQKALVEAAGLPHSYGYCPAEGEVKLREGLVDEMKRCVYGKDIDLKKEDVALTAGCNMAFVATVMCLADEGDEVVLPLPWYFNHHLLGIKTVPLPTFASDGFLPSVEKCRLLLTEKTKAIVLVTPNNPTGAIYPPSLISSFAALAQTHGIALILDETYLYLLIRSSHLA